MAKGYAVVLLDLEDADAYAGYVAPTRQSVARHGGRVLVSGEAAEVVEGEWPAGRVVVIEFDDLETARSGYHDPEYQSLIPMRQAAAPSRFLLIEGIPTS